MSIYILHFQRPFKHAKHYVGFVDGGLAALESRLQYHESGRGNPLVAAVVAAGIPYTVAAFLPGPSNSRDEERKIKNRGSACRCCPICRGKKRRKPIIWRNLPPLPVESTQLVG